MMDERRAEECKQSLIGKLKQLSGDFNEPEVWGILGDQIPGQFMEHKDYEVFIHDCLVYELIADNGDGTYHNSYSKSQIYTESRLKKSN